MCGGVRGLDHGLSGEGADAWTRVVALEGEVLVPWRDNEGKKEPRITVRSWAGECEWRQGTSGWA